MDVVGTILATIKKEELSFDHPRSLIQGNEKEEKFKRASKADAISHSGKKDFFTCPICGKIYTERQPFVNHKSNHTRNKKLKELGVRVHTSNKVGCEKLKDSDVMDKSMVTISDTELKKTDGNNNKSEVETKRPVKLMINSDVVHSMNHIQEDAKNIKFKSASNANNVFNSDNKQFDRNTKRRMFAPHKQNKTFEEVGLPSSGSERNFGLSASDIGKEMSAIFNTEVKEAKGNAINSEVAPVKVVINSDVTANPMSCVGDWMPLEPPVKPREDVFPRDVIANPKRSYDNSTPLEPGKPYVDICPTPSNHLSSDDSAKTNQINAKKTSFKCNICDRIFTKKKTFVNHKTNHAQNKKKHKSPFYKRPNKQEVMFHKKKKKKI